MAEFNILGSIQKPVKMRNSIAATNALVSNTKEEERGSPMGKRMQRENSLVTIEAGKNDGLTMCASPYKPAMATIA